MDRTNAYAIALLDAIRCSPRETGPVELKEGYLRAIDEVEALPQNRPGADKTWIEQSRREFRDYFTRVRRERGGS